MKYIKVLILLLFCNNLFASLNDLKRLTDFSQKIELISHPSDIHISNAFTVKLKITNTGSDEWFSVRTQERNNPNLTIFIFYRIFDSDKQEVLSGSIPLPHNLKPKESDIIQLNIKAPENVGNYTLFFTMLQETIAWFSDRAQSGLSIPVLVTNANGWDVKHFNLDVFPTKSSR